jgi:hypothetical protein
MLVETQLLRAALLCAATHKNSLARPVLVSVYIEPAPGGAWIVSTDGCLLFAAWQTAADSLLGDLPVIIPRETLEAVLKTHKGELVAVTPASVGPMSYLPLDMRFPEWRRVAPKPSLTGAWPEAINPFFLGRATQAVNIANGVSKDSGVMTGQYPDGDNVVVQGLRDKCLVKVMGRRGTVYDADKNKITYRPLGA